ncbi:hypothetical protein STCU_00568 [Strigomonas culicis]|uniref:C3H1-type domain-containing protein n=1 Tax=Strigomonas culicis TaxID=28005 RepID=S9V5X2_9TRYP|nr:hypothetical protein STCU_00568 [Strigomonas culicis]|eukprot:EPY36464.1 hypothetical protein STCU_00568 [Strigomonas culicis]
MSSASSVTSRSKKVRSRKWDIMTVPTIEEIIQIPEKVLSDTFLPSGYCIRFFCHDMYFLYTVPSSCMKLTRGVVDHLHDYNQLGPNKSRNRLFLCSQYNSEQQCVNGSLCREVHCTLCIKDAQEASKYSVPSNATGSPNLITVVPQDDEEHFKMNQNLSTATNGNITVPDKNAATNDDSSPLDALIPVSGAAADPVNVIYVPEGLILQHSLHSRWTTKEMHRTLPAGVTFWVALPNTSTPIDSHESEDIFVTKGAEDYYNQMVRGEPSSVTMQHCAHYSKNGVCCYGEDCQFVHVVHYHHPNKADGDLSGSDTDVASLASSINVEPSKRKGKKANKETPLSVQAEKSAKKSERTPQKPSPNAAHLQLFQQSAPHVPAMPPMQQMVPPQIPQMMPNNTMFMPPGWQTTPQLNLPHGFDLSKNVMGMQPQGAQVPAGGYMMMQGPNGEMFVLPQQNGQPSFPVNANANPQQQFYFMPLHNQ